MKKFKPYKYNPLKSPKAKEWLAMDEGKRIELIKAYHRKNGGYGNNLNLHASIHVIIENQAALKNETPVAAKLKILERQGLDRHEAVHAVGNIVIKYFFDISNDNISDNSNIEEMYFEDVRKLTRQSWENEFE